MQGQDPGKAVGEPTVDLAEENPWWEVTVEEMRLLP